MTKYFYRKFKFSLQEVDGFRYRAKDAWKAVTRIAVREARLKEIKQEILNSKKLKVCHIFISKLYCNYDKDTRGFIKFDVNHLTNDNYVECRGIAFESNLF